MFDLLDGQMNDSTGIKVPAFVLEVINSFGNILFWFIKYVKYEREDMFFFLMTHSTHFIYIFMMLYIR